MKKLNLRTIIFMALCCDFGLFAKRLIAPAANLITDALRIPGGIGTSFSLMFLVIAAALVTRFGCGMVMAAVQSVLALSFGMVGSMGVLGPIGYILPGIVIDLILGVPKRIGLEWEDRILLANVGASVCAAMAANAIVFHLAGLVLLLYVMVAATSGAVCGWLAGKLVRRLAPILGAELRTGRGNVNRGNAE